MKKFDWEKFKTEKIAVHCKTEDEAKDFCQKMHEQGMKLADMNSFLKRTKYHTFQKNTCYSCDGYYCYYDYYKENEYTILEWSDYMRKEFTKADLKDGMVVEYRNGERRIIIDNMLIGKSGFSTLNKFSEELKDNYFDEHTIVKTYKISEARTFAYVLNDNNLELIWERTEVKRMTAEEMCQKLEEFTGEKIEVEHTIEEKYGAIVRYCDNRRDCGDCKLYDKSRTRRCMFEEELFNESNVEQCYEKMMEDGRKE